MSTAEVYLNPRRFVAEWSMRDANKGRLQSSAAAKDLILDYWGEFSAWRAINQSKAKPLDRRLLSDAFDVYLIEQAEAALKSEREAVKCVKEDLTPLKQWLAALCGTYTELEVAVMAHWLWQVKRRAFDLKVVYHIMPIFRGKQGGGKSEAIKALIKPLEATWASFGMDALGDNRNYELFSQSLIAFFDELQRIQKTDLNVLKNQITTDRNTYRILGTHRSATVPMRCSFIGATNTPLNENFSDVTGMRRFYEYITLDKADWAAINAIDYLKLWQGIDETRARGYQTDEIRVVLEKHQEQYTDEDIMDLFITELQIMPVKETKVVSRAAMYDTYAIWAGNNGLSTTSSQWLTKKLKNKGIDTYIQANLRYFVVNADSVVGQRTSLGVAK